MNPGSAPERVVPAQNTDQIADVFRHGRTSGLAVPNLPPPKPAKAFPVPVDHRRGWDEKNAGAPVVPNGAEPSPQESIGRGELGPLHGALRNPELMAECEDFQLQRRTAPEGREQRGRKRREQGSEREWREE